MRHAFCCGKVPARYDPSSISRDWKGWRGAEDDSSRSASASQQEIENTRRMEVFGTRFIGREKEIGMCIKSVETLVTSWDLAQDVQGQNDGIRVSNTLYTDE